jgi:hypothetical protein
MKLIYLMIVYWWFFFVVAIVMLIAKTPYYEKVLMYVSQYNGQFWWVFVVTGLIAGVLHLLLNSVSFQ